MYEVRLTESYFPAQGGEPERLVTIGALVRGAVATGPGRLASKELGYDGAIGRVRTYAALLDGLRG